MFGKWPIQIFSVLSIFEEAYNLTNIQEYTAMLNVLGYGVFHLYDL